MKIRKAVFPVAGLGTRFLPATKASPKEMLPVVDKPIIQYAVEEAIAAGITELIFVTSITKRAIEDHFDTNYELEAKLAKAGKAEFLKVVRDIIPKNVACAYVRQPEALGLGHAVLCARPLIGDEPFAILLADDMIWSDNNGCLADMVHIAEKKHSSVVAVERVGMDEVSRYGVIDPLALEPNIYKIQSMVEKPTRDDAPSDLAVVGRYVLVPRILSILEETKPDAGGEIQLTDAISTLLDEQRVLAHEFSGIRYDCGSKLGYLKATVEYAMRHPELNSQFTEYLKSLTQKIEA